MAGGLGRRMLDCSFFLCVSSTSALPVGAAESWTRSASATRPDAVEGCLRAAKALRQGGSQDAVKRQTPCTILFRAPRAAVLICATCSALPDVRHASQAEIAVRRPEGRACLMEPKGVCIWPACALCITPHYALVRLQYTYTRPCHPAVYCIILVRHVFGILHHGLFCPTPPRRHVHGKSSAHITIGRTSGCDVRARRQASQYMH